jgi:hypothetical protein
MVHILGCLYWNIPLPLHGWREREYANVIWGKSKRGISEQDLKKEKKIKGK